MTFIINRFFVMMSNLTRQSYKDLKSVTKISEMRSSILLRVIFKIESTSNSWIIAYSSAASTLRVTRLHLIDDQCMIFAENVESAKQTTYSIWDERSRLFANETSMNITSLRIDRFRLTYLSSRCWFFICHFNRLFNRVTSSEKNVESVNWTAYDKSNDVFDWHIVVK